MLCRINVLSQKLHIQFSYLLQWVFSLLFVLSFIAVSKGNQSLALCQSSKSAKFVVWSRVALKNQREVEASMLGLQSLFTIDLPSIRRLPFRWKLGSISRRVMTSSRKRPSTAQSQPIKNIPMLDLSMIYHPAKAGECKVGNSDCNIALSSHCCETLQHS